MTMELPEPKQPEKEPEQRPEQEPERRPEPEPAERPRKQARKQEAHAPHVHAVALREEDMPPAFARWLADNRIDPRVYTLNNKLPRYVRRNPRLPQPSAAELSEQLGACQPASPRAGCSA